MTRRQRTGPRREVLTDVMCRESTQSIDPTDASGYGQVTGLSSQLVIGLALYFVPDNGVRPSFPVLGNDWSLYGLVQDAVGSVVRLSETRLNGAADVAIPEGWEGTTTLHGIEVDADFNKVSRAGEWRLSVTLEPVDPSMDDACFEQLVGRVQLAVPTVALVYAGT
jgi:hypothetical protein